MGCSLINLIADNQLSASRFPEASGSSEASGSNEEMLLPHSHHSSISHVAQAGVESP